MVEVGWVGFGVGRRVVEVGGGWVGIDGNRSGFEGVVRVAGCGLGGGF